MPSRPVHTARYRAIMQLLRTADTLWHTSHALFAAWRLSPSQFNVLNLLYEQLAGLSQTALSEQLLMHRSNATGLLDRLEARGLVQRRTVPKDRRAHRVVLTQAGRRTVRAILPAYYQAVEQIWGDASAHEIGRLAARLAAIAQHAERLAANLSKPTKSESLPNL